MRIGLLTLALLLALAAPAAAAPKLVDLGSFDRPLYVTSPPNDQRIFVVEKGGVIKLVGGGTFLDISSKVNGTDEERGLLSMAFSPNYASNGLFYVVYTEAGKGTSRWSSTSVPRRNPNVRRSDALGTSCLFAHTAGAVPQRRPTPVRPRRRAVHERGDAHIGSNAQD